MTKIQGHFHTPEALPKAPDTVQIDGDPIDYNATSEHKAVNNEPIAIQCNFCFDWSKYKKEYCTRLPNGWRDIPEKGFQCNDCRKGKKK